MTVDSGVAPGPWFPSWDVEDGDLVRPHVIGPDFVDPEGKRWATDVAGAVSDTATAEFIARARTDWPIDAAALADIEALIVRAQRARPRWWVRAFGARIPIEQVLAVLTARAHAHAQVPNDAGAGVWGGVRGTLVKPRPRRAP